MNTTGTDNENLTDKDSFTPENEANINKLSREELVAKLKTVLNSEDIDKNILDEIKQAFYKKHKEEQAEALKKFLQDGGVQDDFVPQKDTLEEELKQLFAEYRTKKAEQNKKQLDEMAKNLSAKLKLVEQLKVLTDDLDGIEFINDAISKVREIQSEWKAIGQVAAEKANDLRKEYNSLVEKFYDYMKINNELREYDLKKNLEMKTALCEQAEKLAEEKDVQTSFRILQTLHDEWKEIGPVVRELREDIWERFKNASAVVNKAHHDFFEKKKEEEEQNLTKKTELCEKVSSIDYEALKTNKDWEAKTAEVIEIQNEWKKIGFAPKKANVKVYEQFRKVCDEFFNRKNEFYQKAKSELNENLTKKIALCEKAEALKDNTDWKETSDKFIKLQKEWKTIGLVPRKQSDAVWKRFIDACDYFFEQKGKNMKGEKAEQDKNLQLKKDIIAKIESLDIKQDSKKVIQELKDLIAEFNAVGFVPFKEKDKIYKAFKKATDDIFDKLNIDELNRRLHLFKTNIEEFGEKATHKLFRERDKLKKELEALSNEIATYENNISFFSYSKKADKFIKDIEKKIEKLRAEKDLLLKKIGLIENNLS
jgi:hypothetical protein